MKISSVAAALTPLAAVAAETAPLADVVNVGAHPYYLLDKMKPSSVKDMLGMILKSLLFFPLDHIFVPYYSLHTQQRNVRGLKPHSPSRILAWVIEVLRYSSPSTPLMATRQLPLWAQVS